MNNKNIKLGIGAVLVALILGAGLYFFGPQAKDRTVMTDTVERITNKPLEFSFAFKSGEDALSSMDSIPGQFSDESLKQMYVLMETKALDEFQNKTVEAGETPPAISVLVFVPEIDASTTDSLSQIDELKLWVEANPQYTNVNLPHTDIVETEIDGATALHFIADGLYSQDTYVAKYHDQIYLFVGQYIAEDDFIHTAFLDMIKTVLFE